MTRSDQPHAHRTAVKRALLWNPTNHWQVWLLFALPLGLAWLIAWWCIGNMALLGLAFGSVSAIAAGAIQSYKLQQRRDAATTAEWTSARQLPRP
jgi:hypothetical protein